MDDATAQDHETSKERVDRELMELLNEIRVALPGVQVLFAFLLAVPFQNGWSRVTGFQRDCYFVALCLALLATALLMAPPAYHRINFREHNKQGLVKLSNKLTVSGIIVLGLAMSTVMLLISDVLFNLVAALAVAAVSIAAFLLLWVIVPMRARTLAEEGESDGA